MLTRLRLPVPRPLFATPLLLLACCIVLLSGCDTPLAPSPAQPDFPDLPDPYQCSTGAGTLHENAIERSTTWRRIDAPHRVRRQLTVGGPPSGAGPPEVVLTIEPGSPVCFADGAGLDVAIGSAVVAAGTQQLPIMFAPMSDGGTWSMTQSGPTLISTFGPTSVLRHVQLRGGSVAIFAPLTIDSVWIRGGSVNVGGNVRITRSLIEDAPVAMWGGELFFQATHIKRGSLVLKADAQVRLISGRIEDSPGTGLIMSTDRYEPRILQAGAVRIVGARGYPAQLTAEAASQLLASPEKQDSLLGNARDTLIVFGTSAKDLTIRPGLPWKVHPDFQPVITEPKLVHRIGLTGMATLRMEPGAALVGGLYVEDYARVLAMGTVTSPVTVYDSHAGSREGGHYAIPDLGNGLVFRSGESPESVLLHARLLSTAIVASGAQRLYVDSSYIGGGSLALRSAGSRITDSRVEDAAATRAGAVVLDAPFLRLSGTTVLRSPRAGIVVSATGVMLKGCHVENSGDAGVHVRSGEAVAVKDCNLVDNGGAGVENEGPHAVDATMNWWGHVGGPVAGDGVIGLVLTVPYRTAPLLPGGSN